MPTTSPSVVVTQAAQAAAAAATNAAKSGLKTSEFWVSIGAAIAGVVAAVLLPTPVGPIVAGALVLGAAGYSKSRGDVKAAALSAVTGAASSAAAAGGVVGDVGAAVEVVAGAAAAKG